MEKKLVYITQNYPPEIIGGSTRASDFVRNLSRDYEISVICPHPTVPFGIFRRDFHLISISHQENVKIIHLFTYQPSNENPLKIEWKLYYFIFSLLSGLYVILNHKKFDLVLTTSPPLFTAIPGIMLKKIFGKPWIVDVRDLWLENVQNLGLVDKSSIEFRFAHRIEHMAYHQSDLIFSMTQTLADKISASYDIPQGKFTIVPHSIDTDTFLPATIRSSEQNLIYTGKIRYGGGLEKFVLAMDYLKNTNIHFTIIGEGELKKNIEKIIFEKQMKNVTIKSVIPREKIPEILSGSMVGIIALEENIGLDYAVPTKLLECMSCGIPVISTDVGGEVSNIIRTARCGILVRNTPEDIERAIRSLLENSKSREEMGKNGRSFVVQYCNKDIIISKINSKIEKLFSS
jgi:glycosyltransferase involved in cell wall biosynthesis